MDPQNVTVSSGLATLNVLRWGTAGRVLLALHPGVGDSRIWSSCAPRWAAAGNQVIAFDRRGFGFTNASPEPHKDVSDLLAVMDAARAVSAVIVGNCRGGGLAIDLAISHPDRVSALVLIAPSPSGYDHEHWPTTTAETEQDALIVAAEEAQDLELVNRLETRYWLDGVAQAEGRVTGPPRELFTDMNSRALHASPIGEASPCPPAWPLLFRIEVPVLVVAGEFDLPGIRNQCRELVAALPMAEFVEIADSAHCPQLDQADILASTVLEFLDRLSDDGLIDREPS
jgi:pimeloyl-ACP methyl ester carboxylesterase